MIFRLLGLILLALGLVWAYQTGILESISSGGEVKVGRTAKLCGPIKGSGVPAATDIESLAKEIDAHQGSDSDNPAVLLETESLYRKGLLVKVPENTKVSILESSKVMAASFPHKIAKVRVLSGTERGTYWVERENVIDTPLQEVMQLLRSNQSRSRRKLNTNLIPGGLNTEN